MNEEAIKSSKKAAALFVEDMIRFPKLRESWKHCGQSTGFKCIYCDEVTALLAEHDAKESKT